ncbi:ankyrin repeat-containing domain protein [Rhodocollybia butyracea]|uniref:Ankyrin repeat-containing domain protein n=1 Tax=Rhodocollybia butyracea TaxID=206335 RepID=A0A9P5PF42_9AGAR|nr:ankyrin repeat-containing domain protein [Rhodocollybia butyracea]
MTGENLVGSIFTNASNFTLVNPQFQAARIINNYQAWGTNDILAIQNWLKAPDPSTNFVAACDKRTPATGNWIFSDPQFAKWYQGTSGVLWIQGKVGSGKTILSSTIIEALKANPEVECYYYYFDNRENSKTKTNARGLLQSVVLQMATRPEGLHPALCELYTRCKQGIMEPTTKDLSATLAAIAKDLGPAFLVLDAMDECSEANTVFKHLALLKDSLCIAITSRYLAEASYGVTWSIHLDLADCAFHEDIGKYLRDKLSNRKLKPGLFTEILDCLTESAQGQFRWVECQVIVLQRCATPKAIQNALKQLPKTLEETYIMAIERLKKSEHFQDGVQLLMWLTYAFRPLSIAQFTEILAVDLNTQTFNPDAQSLELENRTYDILDSTLITVGANKIVQLAHNSVKEFLTQVHISKLFEIDRYLAHSTICQTCIVYLLQFSSQGSYDFRKNYPLALYAAEYWPLHMKGLENELLQHEHAKDLAVALVNDSSQPQYINWLRIHRPDSKWFEKSYNPTLNPSKISTPLYYMAYHGLPLIVEHLLLHSELDVNVQGGKYGSALQAAVISDNEDTVKILLQHKADVNAQGGEYGSSFQAATYMGNKNIIQLLLEHNANINASGGQYGSALQAAIWKGNKDIVQLLLEHKADANGQYGQYGSPLQAAAYRGRADIVQLLLEHKADVNVQNGQYGSALQAAATRGKYGNALMAAVRCGNKAIVQLLLEHKADVNAQGERYGNALQAAVHCKNKRIVQLLLEYRADVNAHCGQYGSALQVAIYSANKDIVQLLLEHKADVNAHGGQYGTALQAACLTQNEDIVRLLLENKANVNVQGGEYGTALQAAAYTKNKRTVQTLLEYKADVNTQAGKYGSVLLAAIIEENKDIVQLLLDHGADVNANSGLYGSALQAAAIWGNKDINHLLLEHKAYKEHQPECLQSAYGHSTCLT